MKLAPPSDHVAAPRVRTALGAVPLVAAAVVVLARLAHLTSALGIDESGFLLVGGQWAPGGRSLYGDYFVDRPPLLLTLYQLAAALGGVAPLRVLGALAAGVTVVATGLAARRTAGGTAGATAAFLAGALLVNPLAGTREVNGELLAAPFTAVALASGVYLLVEPADRGRLLRAAVAGACATAAVLVKQNMLDAAAFLAVLGLLSFRTITPRHRYLALGGLAVGSVSTLALAVLWTVAHGTSPAGVLFAMYPFRWEAAGVLARTASDAAGQRAVNLLGCAVVSGMVLLLGALAVGTFVVWRRHLRSGGPELRLRAVVLGATVCTTAYAMASVVAGGSYWSHYLTELVVPLSLGAGIAVEPRRWPRPILMGLVGVSAVTGFLVVAPAESSEGEHVDTAIASASTHGDTIVTIWGHSDVDYASGLSSPYPQLWSLPTRTLDPRLTLLTHTLSSPAGPTWFIAWPHVSHDAVDTSGLAAAVEEHYRPVANCPGWTVYLRAGAERPVPDAC